MLLFGKNNWCIELVGATYGVCRKILGCVPRLYELCRKFVASSEMHLCLTIYIFLSV